MVPRARMLPVDFTALGLELMADQMTSYKSIVVFFFWEEGDAIKQSFWVWKVGDILDLLSRSPVHGQVQRKSEKLNY